MEDLTLLLKEELRKKAKKQEYIKKSFSTLNESTDDRILWEYIEISSKLIDEGYNPDEFDLIVEQDVINRVKDAASNAIQDGGLVDMGKKAWDKTNVAGALTGGLFSALKERIILGILNFLGIKGSLVNFIIVAFNDFDVRDILKPFKNKDYCTQYAPGLIDGIIEGILSSAMEKDINSDFSSTFKNGKNAARVSLRNMISQAEKQSNFGETLSGNFCKTIWG